MKEKGWRPFWAALLAALLVLLPLVGGTVLLTRRSLRTRLASRPQSGVAIRQPKEENRLSLLVCIAPHRDDSTRLSAALPECQSELHPCAGSARRADRPLRGGRNRPLRLLPRRRPGPLPGSTSLSSLPARGHPLSRPCAVRSASHRRPVRDASGGFFGSADRRGAGPHRVQFQCAGHLGPGGRRTAQRDGGHCPARPQSRRPGGGVGRLFPAGAGASARYPAGRPARPQLEPAHRFDGAGPAHLRRYAGISRRPLCRHPHRGPARGGMDGGRYTLTDDSHAAVQTLFNVSPTEGQLSSASEP